MSLEENKNGIVIGDSSENEKPVSFIEQGVNEVLAATENTSAPEPVIPRKPNEEIAKRAIKDLEEYVGGTISPNNDEDINACLEALVCKSNKQPSVAPKEEPQPDFQPGKGSKSFGIFVCIAILLITIFSTITVCNIVNNKRINALVESGVVQQDGKEANGDSGIIIEGVPGVEEKEEATQAGDKLSSTEIAEKCQKSNVSVTIYVNKVQAGEGSGVVAKIDDTDTYTYVITCAHVVDTAKCTIKVTDINGKTYGAELVGSDARTDIAVLKVKTTKLEPAEFGSSDDLKVGEQIYAIGNPGGSDFFASFTGGYVSAINRLMDSESGYTGTCIQHDAAINPGNSGGMLVNEYGQVVGINSQKIASTAYEGMGFAVPTSVVTEVVNSLIKNGYVADRAILGIAYYQASDNQYFTIMAKANGLPEGSLVLGAITNPSLSELKEGDFIVGVNGKEMTDRQVLINIINSGKVGDEIKLSCVRFDDDFKATSFEVTGKLIADTTGTTQSTTEKAVEETTTAPAKGK